jgi:hypothetical protein
MLNKATVQDGEKSIQAADFLKTFALFAPLIHGKLA